MLHTFDGSPPRRIGGRLAPVTLDHAGDQVIRRHAHRLQWLEPGEGEQPLRQLPTAQGRIERIVHQLAGLRAVHRPGTGQAEIGDDHTQKIVEVVRKAAFPASKLHGEANLLIMPNVEAANITYNLLKMVSGEGVTVGPFLLGADKPVHILTPAATVRRIINMTAVASANARVAKVVGGDG